MKDIMDYPIIFYNEMVGMMERDFFISTKKLLFKFTLYDIACSIVIDGNVVTMESGSPRIGVFALQGRSKRACGCSEEAGRQLR